MICIVGGLTRTAPPTPRRARRPAGAPQGKGNVAAAKAVAHPQGKGAAKAVASTQGKGGVSPAFARRTHRAGRKWAAAAAAAAARASGRGSAAGRRPRAATAVEQPGPAGTNERHKRHCFGGIDERHCLCVPVTACRVYSNAIPCNTGTSMLNTQLRH